MDPGDQQVVATMAAKAANMAVAGHETAMHGKVIEAQDPSPAPAGPTGFLQAAPGVDSSKRLESFIGLGLAAVTAVLGMALKLDGTTIGIVSGAFLTYSLAMQGVSAAAERNGP